MSIARPRVIDEDDGRSLDGDKTAAEEAQDLHIARPLRAFDPEGKSPARLGHRLVHPATEGLYGASLAAGNGMLVAVPYAAPW